MEMFRKEKLRVWQCDYSTEHTLICCPNPSDTLSLLEALLFNSAVSCDHLVDSP